MVSHSRCQVQVKMRFYTGGSSEVPPASSQPLPKISLNLCLDHPQMSAARNLMADALSIVERKAIWKRKENEHVYPSRGDALSGASGLVLASGSNRSWAATQKERSQQRDAWGFSTFLSLSSLIVP